MPHLQDPGEDGCTYTTVTCRNRDDTSCAEISISATGASGMSSIGSAADASETQSVLTCNSDGTWSSGTVTGITEAETVAGGPEQVIGEQMNLFYANADITCGNDGMFFFGTVTGITRLRCSYAQMEMVDGVSTP
ncbi:hypothetical protein CRE_23495 [Caenorhabditis remanei]|uniref:DUF281 domain-containing protein n=1 Tax=Caenorhabditis remanei TaxID=31234 RepID=E3MH07_CAERE|nr:hypothetical protein CRE_23495 [Caenorhabditis remanei]